MNAEKDFSKRVLELLAYDKDTGIFVWRQQHNKNKIGDVAGTNSSGYVCIFIDGRNYRAHRLAWLITHGSFPANYIDHRNGKPADNRLCNLREATQSQNMQNLHNPLVTNKCGFLGVDFNKASGSWRAQIRSNGKKQYLGVYDTAELAHDAYLLAKQRLHEFNQLTCSNPEPKRRSQSGDGASGVNGVARNNNQWVAYAPRSDGKQKILGRFTTMEDAVKVRTAFDAEHL